jgi:hypothetical protein
MCLDPIELITYLLAQLFIANLPALLLLPILWLIIRGRHTPQPRT